MIFIVEGPDGSGKTTLCHKLLVANKGRYLHFSYPKNKAEADNMFTDYMETLIRYRDEDVVIDRMWPSTQVYGEILRGKSEISYEQGLLLEKAIKSKGVFVYCTDTFRVMWDRCKQRGEDYVTDYETYLRICRMYDTVMRRQKHILPVLTYTAAY